MSDLGRLVGKCFVTLDTDGFVNKGGVVVENLPPAGVLVEWINWITGEPGGEQAIWSPYDIADMKAVWFASTDSFWHYVKKDERRLARHEARQRAAESGPEVSDQAKREPALRVFDSRGAA